MDPPADETRLDPRDGKGREKDVARAGGINGILTGNRRVVTRMDRPIRAGLEDESTMVALGDGQGGARVQEPAELDQLRGRVDVVAAQPDEIGPVDERIRRRLEMTDGGAGNQFAEEALPANRDDRRLGRHGGPIGRQLRRDRGEDPTARAAPGFGDRAGRDQVRSGLAELMPAIGPFKIDEYRAIKKEISRLIARIWPWS